MQDQELMLKDRYGVEKRPLGSKDFNILRNSEEAMEQKMLSPKADHGLQNCSSMKQIMDELSKIVQTSNKKKQPAKSSIMSNLSLNEYVLVEMNFNRDDEEFLQKIEMDSSIFNAISMQEK